MGIGLHDIGVCLATPEWQMAMLRVFGAATGAPVAALSQEDLSRIVAADVLAVRGLKRYLQPLSGQPRFRG